MRLKAALQEMTQDARFARPLAILPERTKIADLALKLLSLPAIQMRSIRDDMNVVASRIFARLEKAEPLERRQLRQAPWCLWRTTPAIASDAHRLGDLLAAIEESSSSRPFRTLASAWLVEFDENLPHFDAVSDFLGQLADKWPSGFQDAHRQYRLFDKDQGPQLLAEEICLTREPVISLLEKLGLRGLTINGGFARAVTGSALKQLASGSQPDHLERLQIVKTLSTTDGKRLMFEALKPDVAASVLQPCLKEMQLHDEIKKPILDFMLGVFGDPRLRRDSWINVDPQLKDLVVRWLSRASLRQFLDVVDNTAETRMWRYRRAFWEAVFNTYEARGMLVEAWVAFGQDGINLAKRYSLASTSFGELVADGKQVEGGHSVLLMKIADVTIADWSHNGRCNVWLGSQGNHSPDLYRPRYGSDEVRIVTDPGNQHAQDWVSWTHGGSENYTWQNEIARVLAGRLRHRVPQSSYRV